MGSPPLIPDPPGRPGAPYLLDTHVWVWYLVGSPRLPDGLRSEMDASLGELWLSPISVWELGLLEARGRVALDGGLRRWYAAARRALPLEEASLTGDVALQSHDIDLGHRDPADHILAATALIHGLTLLTMDERLAATSWLPTRSE